MALRRLQHGTRRRKQLPPSGVVRLTSDPASSPGLVSCSHTGLSCDGRGLAVGDLGEFTKITTEMQK